jgi:glutaredoxin 3
VLHERVVLTAACSPVKHDMSKPVRVYTTAYCPYCRLAKRLLGERSIRFEEIDVSGDAAARRWLFEATGRRTVPQIFIGERPIGGYDELASLDESGALAALVDD